MYVEHLPEEPALSVGYEEPEEPGIDVEALQTERDKWRTIALILAVVLIVVGCLIHGGGQ